MIFIILCLLTDATAQAHEINTDESSSEELSALESHRSSPQTPVLDVNNAHHVLVVYNRSFCSGSFIGSKVVLTVASCFHQKVYPSDINVKYGVTNYLDKGPVATVVEKKEHEFFQYKSELDNDIALLLLKTHIKFGIGERKNILIYPGAPVPSNSYITVTGWGKDVTKSDENSLLLSDMLLIRQDECLKIYPEVVTASIFCAKYDLANRLSDNGGAAVYNGMILGINSYGTNLEEAPYIALFTNVSYFYKWIKLNTERLLQKHCSQEEDTHSVIDEF